MKRLSIISFVFLLLLSCPFNSVKAQLPVGKIENSIAVLTADKATLLKNYNSNLLKLSAIKGNFTDVTIVSNGSNYYLVFKGAQFKSSLPLKLKPGIDNIKPIFIEDDGSGSGYVSCTISDCASEEKGCVPAMTGLACTSCANKGKCTKTVSNVSLLLDIQL